MNKRIIIALLLLASAAAYAQYPSAEYAIKEAWWRIDALTKLFLCAAWGIVAGVLSLVVIVSGVRYLAEKDLEDRVRARKTVINAFIGLLVIAAACPFVNYLVHGTDVAEFKCDCIPLPPPTTTTTTTTTIPVGAPGTRPTTTTTSTTIMTTTTTWPKTGGGRFLLVGNMKYDEWAAYVFEDLYGVIFNMDGSIYKDAFRIDNDRGPIALAVGLNRFFVTYGSNAVVLDWEGNVVKGKFVTNGGYLPVKALHADKKFYVLLSPVSGGKCVIQVYGLDGNLIETYATEINAIPSARINTLLSQMDTSTNPWRVVKVRSSDAIFPEGDMALADDKLFIVWYESDAVYGIIYGTNGKKLKDKFTIKSGLGEKCLFQATGLGEKAPGVNEYINPEIEAGGKNFLVTFKNRIFLYDIKTGQYAGEKATGNCTYTIDYGGGYNYTWDSEISCVHDLAYGSGKFLAAVNNEGKFYDEDGNDAGCGTFGGHGDQFTTLAYGNKMFVGVVAIHLGTGDGIGASFMDSSGNHLIDTMPLEMAESPGYAAYDW